MAHHIPTAVCLTMLLLRLFIRSHNKANVKRGRQGNYLEFPCHRHSIAASVKWGNENHNLCWQGKTGVLLSAVSYRGLLSVKSSASRYFICIAGKTLVQDTGQGGLLPP